MKAKAAANSAPAVAADGAEQIAKAIVNIDAGIRQLRASSLKERAIVILLRDITGESFSSIEKVLTGLGELKSRFVKG